MIQEKEDDIPRLIKFAWDIILSVHPVTKHIFIKDKGFDFTNKSTFTSLINQIKQISVSDKTDDLLGQAYEDVIKDIMTGKVLGQFFTPTPIKSLMIDLINPQLKQDGTMETIFDPAMGTGGFLITSLRHIMKQAKSKSITVDWNQVINDGLGGREAEPDTYQLAVSNMLISGHIMNNLQKGDSIRDPITTKYDIILTNPPFGIRGLKYQDFNHELKNQYLPIKSNNAVSLFLQAIIYMLKINGRCGVVLPDGKELFSKTDHILITIREYLMKCCDLKEVVILPSGLFSYTPIKTCVFYFEKKITESTCLSIDIKLKNNKETKREYTFCKNHMTKSVKFYEWNHTENEKKFLTEVLIEAIANNVYCLNYTEYIEKPATKKLKKNQVKKITS